MLRCSFCIFYDELNVAIGELRYQIYYRYDPTEIFVLPPAITCGLIRIHTGTFGVLHQIAL
jgi:hypothetical protein